MPLAETVKSTNFIITLAILALAFGTMAAMVWLEKRPRKDLTPSLVPPVPVMLFAGIIALLALVHLVNLLGVHTGR